jgi:signal transduction histidine kinase/HAMP domain-containing protein
MTGSPREQLQSTAERMAVEPARAKRPFGVRLWLALMFAAVGILTGTSVYLFVSGSSEGAAEERAVDLAVGRTFQVRQQVERALPDAPLQSDNAPTSLLAETRSESYRVWLYDSDGNLLSRPSVVNVEIDEVPRREAALRQALGGRSYTESQLPGRRTVVAFPLFRNGQVEGVVLALAERPEEVVSALQALRGQRLTALSISVIVAALIGFLVASLITSRIKRLAGAAGEIAAGNLEVPVNPSGRDEIGDLGRALDAMRVALAETFDALSSERDRLSAIFTALEDAVLVVGADGDVRFSNPAAAELITPEGRPIEPLRPWIRRATHRGSVDADHVSVGEQVFAIGARNLPVEGAAMVVVRDRTEELRRDEAEREFVSNAAHELRNPIAGMSGAIEVLRSGAKDDPEAREHFLNRLAADVERVSRLTKSLLTLARMEAIGEGEADVVSVAMAVEDAVGAVEAPSGVGLRIDADDEELVAEADPVLLRQVLIGLLTNAFKHTAASGTVTLRAHRGEDDVIIEVQDTGTGIPEEERDRVFERFYRGSGSLEREGFGLGLAIAKRMVDVMGGEIRVESEQGKGSTFTVCLPQATLEPTPVA